MLSVLTALALAPSAQAFCGTYVGEPGSTITNTTSQVLIARQGTRTTLTLVNDFAGDPSDFALVIPVPEVLSEDDVRTVIPELVEEAERYSGPRLVEYTCGDFYSYSGRQGCGLMGRNKGYEDSGSWDTADIIFEDSGFNVDVEAEFEAGEYSVVILSAEDSTNLLGWLDANGYGVSEDASALLQESIDAGAYFMAAQVSYELLPPDSSVLSPLQIAYDSEVLSLPIRLGTVNSSGAQDLIVYGINDAYDGQLRVVNYPEATVDDECMADIEDFGAYYGDRLDSALPIDGDAEAHWLLEYSWSPTHCDPCVDGDALPAWVVEEAGYEGSALDATFTRLRIRYTPEQATQDLLFSLSGIQELTQQRYIRYDSQLETYFPLCDGQESADPDELGSCDEQFAEWDRENRRAERGSGCASTKDRAPALLGALAWLMLSAVLRRRRD